MGKPRHKILVVDDDLEMGRLLADVLERGEGRHGCPPERVRDHSSERIVSRPALLCAGKHSDFLDCM